MHRYARAFTIPPQESRGPVIPADEWLAHPEGGSYQVRVSLSRMCMWAHELGLLDGSALSGARPFADIAKDPDLPVKKIASPFGEITYLPSMIDMPDIKPHFVRGPQPLGSSLLEWEDEAETKARTAAAR